MATGVAVAVNLAATPLYHDGASEYPVWKVLNWFMAVGVVTVLATVFLNRRTQGNREEGCPRCALVGGVVFYASVVLASLFFWEWFWTLNPDSETGDAVTSHLVYFPVVDMLYTVVVLVVGRRLWRRHSGAGTSPSARLDG
ncbi:MAG: hypothetical protein OXG37_15170 [Actinomycetia bacterium]|nr:hypothetical protein [Actinomycetes bacterium]